MNRCHIFSDVCQNGNMPVGVFIAGNESPKIVRFEPNALGTSTAYYEICTTHKALDYAIKRFTRSKSFIVHTDIIDIEFLLKKKWFNNLFDNYLERDNIEFHWEGTREYIRYKKCHHLSRIAAGIYDDFKILEDEIWQDRSL